MWVALVPDAAGDPLGFHIAHPVLDYGAPELQKEYRSAGDAVIGPFRASGPSPETPAWAAIRTTGWSRGGAIAA